MKKVDIADGSVELMIGSPNAIFELTGRYQDSREGRSWAYAKQAVPMQTFGRGVHFYYLRGDFPKFLEIVNPRSVFYKVIKNGDRSSLMLEASEDDLRALPDVGLIDFRVRYQPYADVRALNQAAAKGMMSQQRVPFSLREQQAAIAAGTERFLAKGGEASLQRGEKKKQGQPTDYSQPKRKIRFED